MANAVDRSIANLFLQIPIQWVGIIGGPRAVGYLDLALSGIEQARVITLAIFENVTAVVPQAVGRGDYAGLKRNFLRVLTVLTVGGGLYYGAVALASGLVVSVLLGEEWLPAIPAVFGLAVFGAVTTAGGIFGPLYRAFGMMRAAIFAKLTALAVGLPLGALLLTTLAAQAPVIAAGFRGAEAIPALDAAAWAAFGGAVMISLIYTLSIGLTAAVMLPALWRRAGA